MRVSRKASTALATFVLAAATGHLMQSGVTRVVPATTTQGMPDPVLPGLARASITPLSATAPATGTTAGFPSTAAPALPDHPQATAAEPRDIAMADTLDRQNTLDQSRFGQACSAAPTLALTARTGGMIALRLSAGCFPASPLTIRHAGLSFGASTDIAGNLALELPALEPEARVLAEFDGGPELAAEVRVPDLDGLDRVVLLHHHSDPIRLDAVGPADSRLLLGSDGAQAEIVTTRAGGTQPEAIAEVTDASCGREVSAALAIGSGRAEPLRVSMPDCGALGQRVVMPVGSAERLVVAGR